MTDQPIKNNVRITGFTLVELMIAIFILGLVMASVYVSYNSILKNAHQMDEESNIYKMARTAMDRMIKDLSSLQATSLQSTSGSFDLRSEKKTLSRRDFYSLSFWSAAHLAFGENEDTGRPAAISYYVQEDEGGDSFSLWRADMSGSKPVKGKDPGGGFVICQNLDSLILKFYDANAKEYDSWDSSLGEQKDKAPVAIKIELSMVNINDKEKPYKFMTKIFLPVKKQTP